MPLLPIKRILAPVDFSEFSFQALQKAAELAGHFGAELCVLHVSQPAQSAYYLSPYAPNLTDMAAYHDVVRQRADEHLREMIARLPETVDARAILRSGAPAEEIVAAALAEDAQFVVISTHGIGGWRNLMFGAVAEKVIRLSPCAVVVTHAENTG